MGVIQSLWLAGKRLGAQKLGNDDALGAHTAKVFVRITQSAIREPKLNT